MVESSLFISSLLMNFLFALEAAHWSFHDIRSPHSLLELSFAASKEAFAILGSVGSARYRCHSPPATCSAHNKAVTGRVVTPAPLLLIALRPILIEVSIASSLEEPRRVFIFICRC